MSMGVYSCLHPRQVVRPVDHHPRQGAEIVGLVPCLHPAVDVRDASRRPRHHAAAVGPARTRRRRAPCHHAAYDGAGFLHTWAAACPGAQESLQPPYVIDRTLVVEHAPRSRCPAGSCIASRTSLMARLRTWPPSPIIRPPLLPQDLLTTPKGCMMNNKPK